jgi:hypothetical protein
MYAYVLKAVTSQRNSICTSQETHYVSATESSRLMLCKTLGFRGDDYEEFQSSGMLRLVALVTTDVSDNRSSSIIGVTRIGYLGTTLSVTNNFSTHASVANCC